MNERARVDFDDYTENYNQILRESVGFFSENEAYFARYKVEIVSKALRTKPARILEYGCGIGRNIPFLREFFPSAQIEGSDVAPVSLEIARKENPGVHFFLEGEHQPELYDLIFVAGVFHHIPPAQRPGAARSISSRLKPGGEVYVFEHNPYNPVTRRIVNNCPYDEDAILLKPSEMKAHLQNASLVADRHEYCLFIPPKLSAIAWTENLMGWLPLGGQYWVRGTSRPQE